MKTNNFELVNLASENKLIYINSYLHSLKGMIITPVGSDRSVCPPNARVEKFYRTFPVVGEDWQVIDDSWSSVDVECGFDTNILGRIGEPVSICNKAMISAMMVIACDCNRTPIALLEEARRMGVCLHDNGISKTVNLYVDASYLKGCYYIGNEYELYDRLEKGIGSDQYPVANHTFHLGDDFENNKHVNIYDKETLLFTLKRLLEAYSNFFQRTGIRASVTFSKDVPQKVRKQVRLIIRQLNAYMDFLDELNQYETSAALAV